MVAIVQKMQVDYLLVSCCVAINGFFDYHSLTCCLTSDRVM
jgi:hypothetical protein